MMYDFAFYVFAAYGVMGLTWEIWTWARAWKRSRNVAKHARPRD